MIIRLCKVYIFILTIFTVISCKSTLESKKNNEDSSLKLQRLAASNDNAPPLEMLSLAVSPAGAKNEKIINIQDVKSNLNHDVKEEDLTAKSIEELNEGRYQKVIDKLTTYMTSEQKNDSELTLEHMGFKPWRDIYLVLALAYMESGDEMHAQDILDKLIFYADKWEPIYLVLCEKYLKINAFSLARNVALKGIDKLENPSPSIFIYYARAEIGLNNLDQAKKSLVQIEGLYPKNSEALGWLGVVELKSDHIIEACKIFEDSYNLSQENPSIAYNHAACLIQSHQYEKAQSVLKLGFFNSSADPGLYYLGGVLENKQGKPLVAQKYWENYLKLADRNDSRQSYVRAALSAMSQGR